MRVDRDKKMTQAESDEMSELFGDHEPHFCCLFLDRRLSLEDNHNADIVLRLGLDSLWKHLGVFPHQVDACFSQNRLSGPAVKDYSAVWRQTKRDLNITATALSMRLNIIGRDANREFDIDVPFVGLLQDALDLVSTKTDNADIKTIRVSILYGGRTLSCVDILDKHQFYAGMRRKAKAHAKIARAHAVDLETLKALYREAQYDQRALPPNRNLHRHFGDDPRHLPNDGFYEKESLLEALLDNGDLRMVNAVKGQEEDGQPVLWLQDPTFTDQGAARWAAPLWEMLDLHLQEYGDFPAWKDHDMTQAKFFAALGVPETLSV